MWSRRLAWDGASAPIMRAWYYLSAYVMITRRNARDSECADAGVALHDQVKTVVILLVRCTSRGDWLATYVPTWHLSTSHASPSASSLYLSECTDARAPFQPLNLKPSPRTRRRHRTRSPQWAWWVALVEAGVKLTSSGKGEVSGMDFGDGIAAGEGPTRLRDD